MNKPLFYLLSFTWGLPLTLIGIIVGIALMVVGKRPEKWGGCWYFKVGKNWDGTELGLIFLTNKTPSEYIRNHEHGHAIQNCYFGFFMIPVVCIPSAIRYCYRRFRKSLGLENKTPYSAIWFEHQADILGDKYLQLWGK